MSNTASRVVWFACVAALAAPADAPAQVRVATVAEASTEAAAVPTAAPTLMLAASGSTVIRTDFPIKRFALTNPAIADATVVDPHELLVDGKSAGNVSLIIWGESQLVHYELSVYPPIPSLQRELHALFPAE